MKLKGLELQGFKSFPDKTKIMFNKGLTAVVGPNGSGKSNISDAIRWVMGEQSTKTLRGAKMEDVIFTGTKQRKSHGFAEVSLIIDNSDRMLGIESDEVVVTRKYYRSGDSDYLINSSNVRLRDVNELFMDTGLGRDGYALVGQGRIAEIVQSKSDERREIFEEAAGISKLRYKKNEAERKLKASEENMLRLKDILSELEERVEPLKEQSQKAKKFIELAEQKKTLEISVWNDTLDKSNQMLKDQSDKIFARQVEYSDIEAEIDGIENKIQNIYDKMQACLVKTEELRNKKSEIEQNTSEATAQIAVFENDILHHNQNIERIKSELASFDENYDKLIEEKNNKQELKVNLDGKLSDIDDEIVKVQQELYNLNEQNDSVSDYTLKLNQRINELIISKSETQMSLAQLNESIKNESETLKNNTLALKQKNENIDKIKAELNDANELLESLDDNEKLLHNQLSGYSLKLDSKLKKQEALNEELNKLSLSASEKRQNAKLLEDLEKNLEGFAYSVKTIINRGKNGYLKGILGTVSQLIDVPDEYAVAIETALGGMLQNIVTENELSAKSAINYLKGENAGRATFLPLTSVKGTKLSVKEYENLDGYISLACDLVKFEEKYSGVIYSLLGRIVVVDDLDTAVILAKRSNYRFKIVTLDGQVVNAGGSMTGGSKNKSQGILSRKADILKLNKQADDLNQKLEAKTKTAKALNDEIASLQAYIDSVNSELLSLNEDKIRTVSEKKRISLQIEQENALIDAMDNELKLMNERINERESSIAQLEKKLIETTSELDKSTVELETVKGENDSLSQKRDELSDKLSELRLNKIELIKDIEAVINSIKELENRDESTRDTSQKLLLQISELESESKNKLTLIEKLKSDINENKQGSEDIDLKITELMKNRSELEAQTTLLRRDERDISDKKEKISQDLARLEERKCSIEKEYDSIIAKLWEEYNLTRAQALELAVEIENLSEAKSKLNSLKNKIKNLGNVNLSAIEEYEEVSSRYEFLSEQLTDVEKSRAELTRLITDLTENMRDIFEESFERINSNFKKIFVELFGGGRAELKLTDESNILESGIEIFVEPPGKIIKNLSLLSGGEQTFVAIAIYFAILKVRPAPFCVLDEIEAALDDVNVIKYAEYLRSMSDKTQFIMITHRRGTMEEADMLYGVTMQEEGVSKLLALNVNQVEEKLKLKES